MTRNAHRRIVYAWVIFVILTIIAMAFEALFVAAFTGGCQMGMAWALNLAGMSE